MTMASTGHDDTRDRRRRLARDGRDVSTIIRPSSHDSLEQIVARQTRPGEFNHGGDGGLNMTLVRSFGRLLRQ